LELLALGPGWSGAGAAAGWPGAGGAGDGGVSWPGGSVASGVAAVAGVAGFM
jgi:hypothetical protein